MPATRPTAKKAPGVAEGEPAVLERLRRDIAVSPEVNRSLKPKATGAFYATEARKRLYALIDEVGQSHEPVQITGKRGNAVLLSEDDWRAIQETPISSHPPYEALVGQLHGACSRRINIQHRLVYQVLEKERIVKVLRFWSHYEYWRPTTGGILSLALDCRDS
jgi:Txe/YoeB family toxin of toxin-antitoxin system